MPKVPYPYEVNGKLITGNGSLIPICSLNRFLLPSLTVLLITIIHSIYQWAYVTGSLLSLVCLAVIVFSLIGWLISFLKFQNSKFREFAGGSSEQNQEDTYMYLASEMLYVLHFLFIWWKIVDIFKLHQ